MVDSLAQRYSKLPSEVLEDDFALCVNATVMFAAEDYYKATRPHDPHSPPEPLDGEQARVRRLKQSGVFEEIEAKLKAIGAR